MTVAQEWILRRRVHAGFVQQHSDLDPVVAQVLYARHIDTQEKIRAFIGGQDAGLGDPLDMADMGRAVERILTTIRAHERIAVYGDFDVDGVTGTVLLVSVLRELGAVVDYYIPDRFEEGYGLNNHALDYLSEQGVSLCITVDCGIRSLAEVDHAQSRGLDMIITDHHTVPDALPQAVAVVDPKRPDSIYAFRELSGVGVAYQLSRALCKAMADTPEGQRLATELDSYLDLVAVGTVADIVPLENENRTLVQWGLNRLRSAPRPGLAALMEIAGVNPAGVSSTDVAFRLAPRLNAAGRLEEARFAYELLMSRDVAQARPRAESLNQINRQRQEILERQVADAMGQIEGQPIPPLLIVEGADYHEGVVGLIASRLREIYYRPTLVLRRDAQVARGSARSVDGFHITRALDTCSDLLERYGGHAQAAGFTLATDQLPAFRERLLVYAKEHVTEDLLVPRLLVDAIVKLQNLSMDTPTALAALGPFGKGNPEPCLASLNVQVLNLRRIGNEGKHLKLDVRQAGVPCACVAFRQGDLADRFRAGDRIDLVYQPTLNHWQGRTSLQLVVQAVRPARC